MYRTCPTCNRRWHRRRSTEPAETWVAASRRSSMHTFSIEELTDLDQFGAHVRRLIREAGITKAELSRRSGISYSYLRDIAVGGRRVTQATLQRLAVGLGCPDDLLDHELGLHTEGCRADQILDELLTAAGSAVAPPTRVTRALRTEALAASQAST